MSEEMTITGGLVDRNLVHLRSESTDSCPHFTIAHNIISRGTEVKEWYSNMCIPCTLQIGIFKFHCFQNKY